MAYYAYQIRIGLPTTVWKVLRVRILLTLVVVTPITLVLVVGWTVSLLATALLVTMAIITQPSSLVLLVSIVEKCRRLLIQLRVMGGSLRGNPTTIIGWVITPTMVAHHPRLNPTLTWPQNVNLTARGANSFAVVPGLTLGVALLWTGRWGYKVTCEPGLRAKLVTVTGLVAITAPNVSAIIAGLRGWRDLLS